MKLVSISRVRNEIDIIEAFVRHNACLVDLMLIVDDGSADGTLDVLSMLKAEGLPISIRKLPVLGAEREALTRSLMRYVFDIHKADWALFLDADEFIEVDEGACLTDALKDLPNSLVKLAWNNFAWSAGLDTDRDDLLEAFAMRQGRAAGQEKIVVPRWLGTGEDVEPAMGNHDLLVKGVRQPASVLDTVRLCHFPIRSVTQFMAKAAVAHLNYAVAGRERSDFGLQYQQTFDAMALGDEQRLGPILEALSRRYPPRAAGEPNPTLAIAPFRRRGGDLRHTGHRLSPLPLILDYAKQLARDIHDKQKTIDSLERDIGLVSEQFAHVRHRLAEEERKLASAQNSYRNNTETILKDMSASIARIASRRPGDMAAEPRVSLVVDESNQEVWRFGTPSATGYHPRIGLLLAEGFSHAEPGGVWTSGSNATIVFRRSNHSPCSFNMDVTPLLTGGCPFQRIEPVIDGRPLDTIVVHERSTISFEVFDRGITAVDGHRLELLLPDAAIPEGSSDIRSLGIFCHAAWVSPPGVELQRATS